VFGTGEDRGVPYIAMPLLKGMSLEDYLTKRGELSIGQTLRIGREAARGLAAAHARGLVHRDVKPANLWLDATARGRVKILDFGLARLTEGGEALTADGAVLGTPAYMAPEQAAGDPATPASDLFSLGAVLYRLAAGRRPFTGHTPYAAFASLATETPVPVRERNPAVPEPLADLIAALLDKDPSRRPGSAADVADALAAIERERRNERHDPATGRPPEPSDAQLQLDRSGDRSRAVPRRQAAWAWAAAGLAAAAAGSAAMAAGWR
jgi:serine/threonine protein kinase